MPKRREPGDGSLFYDEERKRWIYYLPRDEMGKRPRVSGKTKAEVLAKAEEIKAKRAQGLDLDAKQPTIEQFSEVWLRDVVKRTRRASTYASYEQMFRLYINPKLGTIRLDKLTAARVQGWINMLVDAGQGAATVRNAYLRLRGMLDIAVRYRLISANPAKDVDLPPITNDRARALTLSEARTLLKAADARLDVRKPYTTKDGRSKSLPKLSTRYALLYHLLLALGLRRGEGLGLSWADLDWEKGTVQVRRQVQQINGKVVVSDYIKTDAGRRILPVPQRLLEQLRAHWQNQQEERALMGGGWNERDLIFPTETGSPVGPSNLLRHFRLLLTCAGLPSVRLHDLRHTCATLLGERIGDRVIAAILGHTPGTVTARYAKVTLTQMREALEGLYRELTGAD
ncbi:MAG TPA: tyrosine-type recombinase/integrase [Chloroflexaceae bacterium]|nr:tyrosine-type recombinase/integrase [Chloroflexaceae bacterium]